LQAGLADYAARSRRSVVRPVTLGQERLAARVQRLPRIDALLQPQAQRLDELAERLRRGLQDRAGVAREKLQAQSGRLSVPLLRQLWLSRKATLDRVALRPEALQRTGDRARERYEAAARLYRSLDPKTPLVRGFVLVRGAAGQVLTRKAAAQGEPRLLIEFADGALPVVPAEVASAPAPAPRARKRPAPPSVRQDDLFG
jgi:exodeoxyribonuclease VII large subunit